MRRRSRVRVAIVAVLRRHVDRVFEVIGIWISSAHGVCVDVSGSKELRDVLLFESCSRRTSCFIRTNLQHFQVTQALAHCNSL